MGTTSLVYVSISRSNHATVQKAFTQNTDKVKDEVNQEVIRYQNLIATIGAFFDASTNVSLGEFNQFVHSLNTKNSFPGMKGIGYAMRTQGTDQTQILNFGVDSGITFDKVPSSDAGEHATLLYLDPTNDEEPQGSDIYTSQVGKDTLMDAANLGKIVSSVPSDFVTNGEKATVYVLTYPVYGGAPVDIASNAEQEYSGWVLAYIDPTVMFGSLPSLKDLNISITDASTHKHVVKPTGKQDASYSNEFSFIVGQRERSAVITPTPEFVKASYDSSRAFRYALFAANIEMVAVLLVVVFMMHKTRRRREVNLTFQAGHDILTGLPNRYYLEKWLAERVASPTRRQQKVAVLFLDLDGFKAINDTLGHQMGDEFLVAIAQRLQKEIRGRDVLARLGGDEFIVVLDEVTDEMQATRIAQRLIEVVRFPVMLDSGPVCVGASIGIAITQLDANSDSSSVIRFADAAMYAAKEDKVERIRVFDHKLKSIVDGRHEVESSIRGAASRNEIVDVLQPLIQIEDGKTFGYEALCRWSHPAFGVLSPDQFLDAAKVTGEIIEIDRWMVNKAFENVIELNQATDRETRVGELECSPPSSR